MPRGLDTRLQQGLNAGTIQPVFLALLTFRSGVRYVSSASFPIAFNGNVFQGVGTLGQVGVVNESTSVKADGLTLTLSGIDPDILGESLTDIQPLAPAKVWFGLLSGATLVGIPFCLFAGIVDKPSIDISAESATITLALETRMNNLNRPNQRRYTSADQNGNGYPGRLGL